MRDAISLGRVEFMSDALNEPLPSVVDGVGSFDKERELMHRQMLSSVSHDLKTPLASIIGSLEVYERMKDKLSGEKQAALIKVALQEAYRLDNFITNILDMAKLENGLVKAKAENIEIGGLLRNCLTRLDNRLQGSHVEILAPDGPLDVMTDSVLLSRVVCLVLDNAVKYGGTPCRIVLEFGQEGETVFIRIQDNGRGVPDQQMEAIFSKYTRFSKQDKQNAGTGLGLAIGREIMRLLGGGMIVSNHPAGGALFTLSFAQRTA